jgi:hypothetical protein
LEGLWDGGRGSYLSSSPSSPRSELIAAFQPNVGFWQRPQLGVALPGLWDRRQVVLNRWLAPATFTRSSNLLELGSFRELLQLRLPPRIPPAWTEQPHSVWGPPSAYPPTTPLLNQVMPPFSTGDAGSTPRASPEHPPRIPRACSLQPSSSPLMGWFKVLSTPSPPLPKPDSGWGCCLPPEVLPGCGDPLTSHRLVRVVRGLSPPPADPARFISGMSPPKPLSEKPQNKRFLNQHWFRKTLLTLGFTLGYIEFF